MNKWFFAALFVLLAGCTVNVDYSISDTDGRSKLVELSVYDGDNNSLGNASVFVEQISQDFFYNVGDYWDDNSPDEAGTNLYNVYLDWSWKDLEPGDGNFDWDYLNTLGFQDAFSAEQVMVRLGVMSTSAWIYNTGGAKESAGFPDWVDADNNSLIMDKYLEFVTALVNHFNDLSFSPDFYMVEVELNALGQHSNMTNNESIAWLGRLVNAIKSANPDAVVAVDVAAQNLSPFMDEGREKNSILVNEDLYPLSVPDWQGKINSINYDIISYRMQPFGWMSNGNWTDAVNSVEMLCNFNRSVYISWAGFLSEAPVLPEGAADFEYYPVNYSEEWQLNNSLNLMDYLLGNPCVIGVYWDYYDFVEHGIGGNNSNSVRLTSGFTTGYRNDNGDVVNGVKKLVFNPMKELWDEQFVNTVLVTGENGSVSFYGFLGEYKIILSKGLIWRTLFIKV